MKKRLYLFVFLLPVVAFAQSEEELRDKIAREVPKYAPSQQQLAEKAKVKVRVKVNSDFDVYINECDGVITETDGNGEVHIVIQNNCFVRRKGIEEKTSLVQVSFPNIENSLDYFPPTQGHSSVYLDWSEHWYIIATVPLADLSPQVCAAIQGVSVTRGLAEDILKNAPSPKVVYKKQKSLWSQLKGSQKAVAKANSRWISHCPYIWY